MTPPVTPPVLEPQDPFDLPEWLGECDVTWSAGTGVRSGHHVRGALEAEGHDPFPCDLLAVDDAWPVPVADEASRRRAHQAWRHGQVDLVRTADDGDDGDGSGRLALAVPSTSFTADLVLDAVSRLAKAVGAEPDRYAARLRIGSERR